jgi:hypothetical protein
VRGINKERVNKITNSARVFSSAMMTALNKEAGFFKHDGEQNNKQCAGVFKRNDDYEYNKIVFQTRW